MRPSPLHAMKGGGTAIARTARTALLQFTDWYGEQRIVNRYRTNVATAATGLLGGDLMARLVSGRPIDGIMSGFYLLMALYYGWEGDAQYRATDQGIRLSDNGHIVLTPHHASYTLGAGSQRLAGLLRMVTKEVVFSPMSTVRHLAWMSAAQAVADPRLIQADTAGELFTLGAGVYLQAIPIYALVEFFIQTYLPLPFRFLAKTVLNTGWQVFASLKMMQ